MRSLTHFALAAALVATPVLAGSHTEQERSALLEQAVAGQHRSAENRARDAHRHPAQTLAFFGLKPGMTVVEVFPGAGWYTEILAPAVGPRGRLLLAVSSDPRAAAGTARLREKLAGNDIYKNATITSLGADGPAPAGTADMVLTFRNVHSIMGAGVAPQTFQSYFRALKPGGVLGIEQHRLPESRTQDPKAATGYVKQSEVIRMAQAAGFRLAGSSEINANRKDTANYPKGVWTLPPNYAEGDADRARYASIGESDRMTLKFVKPAA